MSWVFIQKWRKWLFSSAVFAAFFFLLGFSYRYHLPRIKSWLLVEIENQSQKHMSARVWPERLGLGLFPPQLIFEGVRIIPKPPLAPSFSPSYIKELRIKLNWIALFRGQFRLAEVIFDHPNLNILLPHLFGPESAQKSLFKHPSLDIQIRALSTIPIDKLIITDLELKARSPGDKAQIQLKKASLVMTNMFDAFLIEANFPDVNLRKEGLTPLDFSFESRFLIDDENLQISALKLRKQSSYFVASGYLNGKLAKGNFESGKMSSRSHFSLPEVRLLVQDYLEKIRLPQLKGSIDLDLDLSWVQNIYPNIQFRTQATGVEIDNFVLGTLTTNGSLSKENILFERLNISNNSGTVLLNKTVIDTNNTWKFSTSVNISELELQQLLLNLTVPKTPLHLDLSGSLPCEGEMYPFQLNCKGKVFGKNLSVHSGEPEKFPIVDVANIETEGEVKVNLKEVTYKAEIKVGKSSTGRSSGTISYSKGFNIDYEGDHVDFSDVQNLAKLKLEGTGKVKGNTVGDSSYGTIKMDINNDDFWMEDFPLGKVSTELQYKEGFLYFKQVKGLFKTSRYTGGVAIDLRKNNLNITGQVPFVDLEDLRLLFARKYLFPLSIDGSGSAEIKVSGPLILNQLNFDLRSSFYRGTVGNESFDELILNAGATNGNVKLRQAYLSKATGRISFDGGLSSNGSLDVVVLGRNLRLEQSENIEKINLNVTGLVDFTTSLRGPIRNPKTDIHLRLSQLAIADKPFEDSNLKIKLTPLALQGAGNIMGNLIKTDFTIPFSDEGPFRLFVETNDLNFTQLFTVFSGPGRKVDFDSKFTSTIDLSSSNGGLFKSSGYAKIDDFTLRRGNTTLALDRPINLEVREGTLRSETFNLQGHSSLVSLIIKDTSKDRLNIGVNGKLDMGLALLFLPFLDDLKGVLSLSGQLKGNWENPEIMGSAFIDNGLLRVRDFPQSFEQIRADLLFSHKKIVVNSASGQLGGGPFAADGKIQIKKMNDVLIDVKGRFKDVSITIPDGVKTKGSGDFFLKGNWFPYSLGGEYQVSQGEVSKEIDGNAQKAGKIKPSSFLPDFLIEDKFQPFLLDWNVILKRPILVKNSLVNSPLSGSLKVSGEISAPSLKGQLSLEKDGKVFFHETPFDVAIGQVAFSGDDSDNPKIFLNASSRVKDEYDINLLIQGRAKDPQFNLSSQPPLTESEIISLLALGIKPKSDSDSKEFQTGELATQTTLQIGSALLQKPLGDINKLTGVEVDVSGATGADQAVVPNLTLKKQWTPKFGISASRTVENNPTNNAKIEYKVNKKLSVVGTWENKEGNPEIKDTSTEKVGVDLEYRLEFR